MTEEKETEYETFYQVYSNGNSFHGSSTLWIAVTEETDEKIIGCEFSPMMDKPGSKVVVMKDNVAGWKEQEWRLMELNEDDGPTPEEVRRAYEMGLIDEDEMEEDLEEALQ